MFKLMILFACDLDNTIIHSYKNSHISDICVEMKESKQISFMTAHSYSLLQQINELCNFVPVTTRSVEQFRRIKFTNKTLDLAITSNGGILLRQGEIDKEWFAESKSMVEPFINNMKDCIALLKYEHNINAVLVDGFFVFGKSNTPEKTLKFLYRYKEKFSLYSTGNKFYIIPQAMNKGNVLKRLQKIINSEYVISAGDSIIDMPMLSIADKSFVPTQYPYNQENFIFASKGQNFSEFVLKSVFSESETQKNKKEKKDSYPLTF